MRQIVLDTETTGLDPSLGHRIIEIGCVELMNRRLTGNHFHYYINPERDIDEGAQRVHGITEEFLADKPLFAAIVEELLFYIQDAELIIHNAPFDIGFLNHELKRLKGNRGKIEDVCTIVDTLVVARQMHPGQRNNLDTLCQRYNIDNSKRDVHGALLDAEILAQVYLAMTAGQKSLFNETSRESLQSSQETITSTRKIPQKPTKVIYATCDEQVNHQDYLKQILAQAGSCVWDTDDV